MSFRLDGDFSKILIPVADKPRINVDLWRHTCFEAFIALEGQPAYHEFNFAPSGEWCIYAFRGYRDGGPLADETIRPYMAISSNENQLELDAVVRLDRLSAAHPQVPIRIGLSAVIEASDGFSYWALRHPAGKPDFHKPDGFALLINPPSPAR
ncbi:MAG TPA: DOMON-like domain-containing protein [Candidatus Binataceae bacterium]|nr:DOMON-like domain-containing protein [Candidatus Binataceae bacterium]